jgi:dynein heavy chain
VETRPQVVNEDEEPVTFSFHTDISANPQVIKTALICNQAIHRSFGGISKFLEGWKRYKNLWKLDKVLFLPPLSSSH